MIDYTTVDMRLNGLRYKPWRIWRKNLAFNLIVTFLVLGSFIWATTQIYKQQEARYNNNTALKNAIINSLKK